MLSAEERRKHLQFIVTLEKDSKSKDLWLPLPEDLLTTADWNVGDRLLVEVVPYRRLTVTNLGKQPTPWDGLPTRNKKRE